MTFWDEIINDDEIKAQIKKLCLHVNPAVSLQACKWVAEGKGFKSGLSDSGIESINFTGLDSPEELPF